MNENKIIQKHTTMRKTLLLAVLAATMTASAQNLLLHFDFSQTQGTTVTDAVSGVKASLKNNAKVEPMGDYRVLNLGTQNGYLDMTVAAGKQFAGTDNYTISTYYYVEKNYTISGNGYFLWAFSTLAANTQTEGKYSAYRVNAQRIATSTGGWGSEKGYDLGTATPQGQWMHVVYTEQGGTGKLYINGELKHTITAMPKNSSNYGTTPPSNCWLGRAPFSGDSYLGNTKVADFRLYDAALSAAEVSQLASETATLTQAMRYGTPGDESKLKQLIAEAQAVVANGANYLTGAVEDLRDVITAAQNVLGKDFSSYALNEYVETLSTALVAVKATKGMTFELGNLTAAYDTQRGFIHPGGLHTQADFDRIKAQLAAKHPTVTAAWNALLASEWSKSTTATWPVETIVRGGSSGQNYINAARGAHIAYENALRWKIAGDKACAKHGVEVLMAWAKTCKLVSGDSNWALAAGLYGYEFAQAAELLRDYEGWSREDFELFKQWMLTVWYPGNIHFLRGRNGTWENVGNQGGYRPGHYWSNWPLCNVLSALTIGILCDDVFIYNQALSFMKYDQAGTFPKDGKRTAAPILSDGCTEFLGNLVVDVKETELETGAYGQMGQMQESGRDGGHAAMALGLAVDIAQTAWNQGDDLYSYMDNRLAAGIEFVAASTQGQEGLPWTNYKYVDCRTAWHNGWLMEGYATAETRPYWGTVLGHYEGVKGVRMPWAEKAYAQMGADAGPTGGASGAYDHLGFSRLLHTRDVQLCPEGQRPTLLSPMMEMNAKLIAHNELGGLTNTFVVDKDKAMKPGQRVTLMPQLPDGAEDTGYWQWNTGQTTRNITVETNRSYVYRVTYTNSNGIQSHQSFAIAVDGDCVPADATGTIAYDGQLLTTDTVSVFYGDPVTLTINGTGGYESYQWSNGATSRTLTTGPIVRPRTFTGVYINQGGARSAVTFRVGVKYMQLRTVVNGKVLADSTQVVVNEGDQVQIGAYVPEILSGCSYEWSNGADTPILILSDIRQSGTYTLRYNVNGEQGESTYRILVNPATDTPIAPGAYRIRHRATDAYLTTAGSGKLAEFKEEQTGDEVMQQVWHLCASAEDVTAFNLQNDADRLFLSAYGRSTKNAPKYVFGFRQAMGTDWIEVHDASVAPRYWTLNKRNQLSISSNLTSITDFPFVLEPYHGTTAVQTIQAEDRGDAIVYNLKGQRTEPVWRGIYIIGKKKVVVK